MLLCVCDEQMLQHLIRCWRRNTNRNIHNKTNPEEWMRAWEFRHHQKWFRTFYLFRFFFLRQLKIMHPNYANDDNDGMASVRGNELDERWVKWTKQREHKMKGKKRKQNNTRECSKMCKEKQKKNVCKNDTNKPKKFAKRESKVWDVKRAINGDGCNEKKIRRKTIQSSRVM